ncbi:hypothetical protein INR49_009436 [Caranx melampygus]|nr:hypothetical protein INR49_009436 [Caranx melampygus]
MASFMWDLSCPRLWISVGSNTPMFPIGTLTCLRGQEEGESTMSFCWDQVEVEEEEEKEEKEEEEDLYLYLYTEARVVIEVIGEVVKQHNTPTDSPVNRHSLDRSFGHRAGAEPVSVPTGTDTSHPTIGVVFWLFVTTPYPADYRDRISSVFPTGLTDTGAGRVTAQLARVSSCAHR